MKELFLVLIGAVIAGVFAGIFTIVGALITYFLSMKIVKRQEYNKAAATFRYAFCAALRALNQVPEKPCYQIIDNEIHTHEIAMMQFKPYLADKEQGKLVNAWREYICSKPESPDCVNLAQYHTDNESRTLVIQRIEKILECAKPK